MTPVVEEEHIEIPDKFAYDIHSPPLHILGSLDQTSLDEVVHSSARGFYSYVKTHLNDELCSGTLLDTGQSLAEYSLRYILSNSLRRKKAARRKQEVLLYAAVS